MDIFIPHLVIPRLEQWERRSIAPGVANGPEPGDRRDAYERTVASEPPGPPVVGGPFRRVAAAILAYDIFPPWLVRGVLRRAPVEVGDTVGIRYRVLGIIELLFAARVVDLIDGPSGDHWRSGFTYQSLVGHPELGAETFLVEKELRTGRVRVTLRSWSRPGTRLARAFGPFARRCQVHASCQALRHLHTRANGTAVAESS